MLVMPVGDAGDAGWGCWLLVSSRDASWEVLFLLMSTQAPDSTLFLHFFSSWASLAVGRTRSAAPEKPRRRTSSGLTRGDSGNRSTVFSWFQRVPPSNMDPD